MRRLLPIIAVVPLLAGCGGDGDDATATRPVAAAPPPSTTQAAPAPQPATVPNRATGPADPRDAAVVRRWSAALRAGRIGRAAAYFAQPSRVQNGTPVITLRSAVERTVFNASLPCGAVPIGLGAADGYTIVTFRLVERVGGDCHGAAGNRARCAIRVRGGRITDWYRLADASPGPPLVLGRPGQSI